MSTLTEVNTLNAAVKNIKGEYYRLMSNRWGPRWASGLRASMVHGERANNLNKKIKNVAERWAKANKNLNAALNRNVNVASGPTARSSASHRGALQEQKRGGARPREPE
jgi:hypothetical protein